MRTYLFGDYRLDEAENRLSRGPPVGRGETVARRALLEPLLDSVDRGQDDPDIAQALALLA